MAKVINNVGLFFAKLKISKKFLAIIFMILFIISLIPIIVTTFYAVPVADDYNFGRGAHLAITYGESFLSGVFQSAANFYNDWQGFYTANFLASMQPYTINVHLYFISCIGFIIVDIFAMFYFIKVILIDVLKTTKSNFILISVPIVTTFIQLMPGISESFYWMDGGIELFCGRIFLIVVSLVIKFHYSERKSKKIVCAIFAVFLSIIISGATPFNLVTCFILLIFSLLYCIPKKYNVYKLQLLIFAILAIGMIVVMLSPGNSSRQETTNGFSFIKSILYSLAYSVFTTFIFLRGSVEE